MTINFNDIDWPLAESYANSLPEHLEFEITGPEGPRTCAISLSDLHETLNRITRNGISWPETKTLAAMLTHPEVFGGVSPSSRIMEQLYTSKYCFGSAN